jgi:hypothetical protein
MSTRPSNIPFVSWPSFCLRKSLSVAISDLIEVIDWRRRRRRRSRHLGFPCLIYAPDARRATSLITFF